MRCGGSETLSTQMSTPTEMGAQTYTTPKPFVPPSACACRPPPAGAPTDHSVPTPLALCSTRRVVEFGSYDDLEYAVRKLDGAKLDGSIISVFRDGDGGGRGRGDAAGGRGGPPPPPPPPPQRHSDRPYDRRDDRRDKYDDRDRDDRDRHDERNRRDRDYDDRRDSRPPPGRHYDERPPPPRGDHGRRDDQDYRGRGRNDRHYD